MNVNRNIANSNVHAEAILYCGNTTNLYKYMKGQEKNKSFFLETAGKETRTRNSTDRPRPPA